MIQDFVRTSIFFKSKLGTEIDARLSGVKDKTLKLAQEVYSTENIKNMDTAQIVYLYNSTFFLAHEDEIRLIDASKILLSIAADPDLLDEIDKLIK